MLSFVLISNHLARAVSVKSESRGHEFPRFFRRPSAQVSGPLRPPVGRALPTFDLYGKRSLPLRFSLSARPEHTAGREGAGRRTGPSASGLRTQQRANTPAGRSMPMSPILGRQVESRGACTGRSDMRVRSVALTLVRSPYGRAGRQWRDGHSKPGHTARRGAAPLPATHTRWHAGSSAPSRVAPRRTLQDAPSRSLRWAGDLGPLGQVRQRPGGPVVAGQGHVVGVVAGSLRRATTA